jgi:U6 snRNA-associated Sm-like protein LSm1
MDDPIILPTNIDEVPPPGIALVEQLDKLLLVHLRDNRKIMGIMRSFDQFANLVLEGAIDVASFLRDTSNACSLRALLPLRSYSVICPAVLVLPLGAKERIIVGTQYAEVPLGLHVVRGENVVLLGEVDEALEPPAGLTLVSEAEIKRAQKADKEAEKMKGLIRSRFDFLLDME